jgi:hypothetical protein
MSDQMRALEGRQVSVALRGGSRIDDCQLVSGGRVGTGTVWLFWNTMDVFIPAIDVLDVWEASTSAAA